MDKFQAAFEILYILSIAEGVVDDRKIQVISNFLMSNLNSINFDVESTIKAISYLSGAGILEEFANAAEIFRNSSYGQERIHLLQFAIEVIAADGNISEGEAYLITYLGDIWNIDLRKLLG
ncbi:TerB family tellurite resistance protein [Calothrix sp. NIES-3974]|uniref:TerB family tellurite resistance protein n=1 Tax=Calothrix sp. NIES-3974 TaxID=2005462 RepID=UPI000B607BD5|nr:TerB family tellurite resistance protein [Calothrix sp. NIES-3974]BAZ03975.1 hypothetical protein NIES3974_06050 [Calothrix sp. NIES-3974]